MISGVQLFPSIYLQTFLHYDPQIVHRAQFWLEVAMFAGGFIGGIVVDAIGWVKAIIGTMILLIVTLFLFYGFTTPASVIGWFIAIGLFLSCMIMLYNPLVHSFRAQTRLTGIATVYNVSAAVFGGATPVLMQFMAHYSRWGLAIYPALAGIVTIIVTPMLWQLRKPLYAE